MKKILFLCCIFILIGCKHNTETENDNEKPIPQPKEITKTVGDISFKMIQIEAVKRTTLGKGTRKNERLVTLSSYYIGETEVTQELYKAVTGLSPSFF